MVYIFAFLFGLVGIAAFCGGVLLNFSVLLSGSTDYDEYRPVTDWLGVWFLIFFAQCFLMMPIEVFFDLWYLKLSDWLKWPIFIAFIIAAMQFLGNLGMYNKARYKWKMVISYMILMFLTACSICVILNLLLNDHLSDMSYILLGGVVAYVYSPLYFGLINSYSRRNRLLAKKINELNSSVRKAIQITERYLTSGEYTKKSYNTVRKNLNKIIKRRGIYKTFQPHFEEDRIVLNTVALMSKLGSKDVLQKYEEFKRKLEQKNTFRLLKKAKKEPNINELRDFNVLLSVVLEQNKKEIKELLSSCRNEWSLYNKYNVLQKIYKKYVCLSIIIFIFLAGLLLYTYPSYLSGICYD